MKFIISCGELTFVITNFTLQYYLGWIKKQKRFPNSSRDNNVNISTLSGYARWEMIMTVVRRKDNKRTVFSGRQNIVIG